HRPPVAELVLIVGAAMGDRSEHPVDQVPIRLPEPVACRDSRNAAHQAMVLSGTAAGGRRAMIRVRSGQFATRAATRITAGIAASWNESGSSRKLLPTTI